MKPDNLEKLAQDNARMEQRSERIGEKLGYADSAADSLLTRIIASRWTAFIVGGALVSALILGLKMC